MNNRRLSIFVRDVVGTRLFAQVMNEGSNSRKNSLSVFNH